ncbi:MAG: hypothetical protein IJB65_00835 [Clostridia bacterium]|nr:hypothetical protein [Clostridia bacterium]
MQDKEMSMDIVMLAVPVDLLEEAGITDGCPMQMFAEKGKLVIEKVDDISDVVCNGDCECCPVSTTDCDCDCDNCPCRNKCEESEAEQI